VLTVAIVLLAITVSASAQTIATSDPVLREPPGAPSSSKGRSRIPDSGRIHKNSGGVDKTGVFIDSLALLGIEHGIRLAFQPGTRGELRGNFWRDYRRSVRLPTAWEDTDSWLVNYVGHPIHGAAAGYLWLEHDPKAPITIEFDNRYWASRGRAAAFAAVYSLQFEIGPISEASLGNVGLRPETTGWVDYAVTPTGAFGLVIAEDLLDKFLVEWIERHTRNRVWRASLRLIFNPARAMSNTAAGHLPWYRPDRTLAW
jgi:hypothetical protein